MTVPAWLAASVLAAVYLAGVAATRSLLLVVDDGPTFVPWLDTLIFILAAWLWPLTWAAAAIIAIVVFLIRLAAP